MNYKSLLDVSSRTITQNSDFKIVIDSGSKRVNHNKFCLDEFLYKYDYKKKSKFSIVNYIEYKFEDYLDKIGFERNGIVLNDDDKKFVVDYQNKYSRKYKEKVERRMRWLCHRYGNNNCVFLTLTMDPKLFDSFVDMWLEIKKRFNRFMDDNIRYKLKKVGYKKLKYLMSVECQHGEKSWFNPHVHCVFIGLKRLMDWRKIRDYWKVGHIWINRTNDGKKIRKPIDYLTKYITKTYDVTDKYNIRDQAVQWFFCERSFSYSKGLLYPLNYSVNDSVFVCKVFCDSCYILDWLRVNCDDYFKDYDFFGGYG